METPSEAVPAPPLERLESWLVEHAPKLRTRRSDVVATHVGLRQEALTEHQVRVLEQYLPLGVEEQAQVIRELLRLGARLIEFGPLDWFPARAVLEAVEQERRILNAVLCHPLRAALRRLSSVTAADVCQARRWNELTLMAELMERLPSGPLPKEVDAAVDVVKYEMLNRRRNGDSAVLRQHLRRGGRLDTIDATIVPKIVAILDQRRPNDRMLLRTMYERGYAGELLPKTQLTLLSGEGLWSVVRHHEAWPLTAHSLIQQARAATTSWQAVLSVVLPPDLVRYINQAL